MIYSKSVETANATLFTTQLLILSYKLTLNFSEGRKHDAGMLADSNLLVDLNHYALSPAGRTLFIYGDPAYPLRVNLQSPFRNAHSEMHSSVGGI